MDENLPPGVTQEMLEAPYEVESEIEALCRWHGIDRTQYGSKTDAEKEQLWLEFVEGLEDEDDDSDFGFPASYYFSKKD